MNPIAKPSLPARARGIPLDPEDVPQIESRTKRVGWIAERLAAGLWQPGDAKIIGKEWGRATITVERYAEEASTHLELLTGDIDKIRALSAMRLQLIAHDHETDAHARIKASEVLLKLTGDLKGGREEPSMTQAEREQAIIDSIAHPDDAMERLLREAFARAGDRLRGLIAEFGGTVTTGEER